MEDKKKKFTLNDYKGDNRGCSYIKGCSKITQTLKCICDKDDGEGMKCFKCGSYTHKCIEKYNNQINKFQCASCICKALDPLFTVKKVLVQSYFQTKNIFEFFNQINFEFTVTAQQLGYPIQIRGLKASNTNLSWPMQGAFYLNEEKQPFYQLKPLHVNSSRKLRKQDYISVPRQKIRPGKNYIRFKIIVVRRALTERYQCQESGIYFMSINSINVISKDNLINETFQKRRLQMQASLNLLSQAMCGLEIVKEKVDLTCPYLKEKIKYPVRGKYCKHFGCACLETIIKFHADKRLWNCPLCDGRINEPVIDLFIYQILKDNTPATTVYIQKNGSYKWAQQFDALNLDDQDSNPMQRQKKIEEKIEEALAAKNKDINFHQDIRQIEGGDDCVEVCEPFEPECSELRPFQQIQRIQQKQPQIPSIFDKDLFEKQAENSASNRLFQSLKNQIMKIVIEKKQKEKSKQKKVDEPSAMARNKDLKSRIQNSLESSAQRVSNMALKEQQKKSYLKQKLFDIPELRSNDQTKEFIKKQQNLPYKIEKQRAIALFLKENLEIKNLFTEILH